jgi:hypothetical protein
MEERDPSSHLTLRSAEENSDVGTRRTATELNVAQITVVVPMPFAVSPGSQAY